MPDLADVFLALHDSGRSVCNAVAEHPGSDLYQLIVALGAARARYAPPLVDVISKSMDPAYAGLLVRDVYDDAEQTAMVLFNSMLATKVTPSLAAQRVGLVYGVPMPSLGRYPALARDPRAHPSALGDLAATTVMSYADKLAQAERAALSKAVTVLEREPVMSAVQFDALHPRSTDGRFVRAYHPSAPLVQVGGGGGQPPRGRLAQILLGQPEPEVALAEPEVAAPPRVRRTRKVRRVRQAPQPVQVTAGPTLAAPTLVPHTLAMQTMTPDTLRQLREIQETVPTAGDTADLMNTTPVGEPFIGGVNSVLLSTDSGVMSGRGGLRSKMAGQDNVNSPLRFRPGALLKNLGAQARLALAGTRDGDEAASEALDLVNTRIQSMGDHPAEGEEIDRLMEHEVMEAGSPLQAFMAWKASARGQAKTRAMSQDDLDYYTELVRGAGTTGVWYVVHWKPKAGYPRQGRRVTPLIHDLHGIDVPTQLNMTRPGEAEPRLDPNQVYEMSHDPDVVFDPELKAKRAVYRIRPVSPELLSEYEDYDQRTGFGKALAGPELARFNQLHPRSPAGQFADEWDRGAPVDHRPPPPTQTGDQGPPQRGVTAAVLTGAPEPPRQVRIAAATQPVTRRRRRTRAVRQVRVVTPEQLRAATVAAAPVPQTPLQSMLTRAIEHVRPHLPNDFQFDPADDYSIVSTDRETLPSEEIDRVAELREHMAREDPTLRPYIDNQDVWPDHDIEVRDPAFKDFIQITAPRYGGSRSAMELGQITREDATGGRSANVWATPLRVPDPNLSDMMLFDGIRAALVEHPELGMIMVHQVHGPGFTRLARGREPVTGAPEGEYYMARGHELEADHDRIVAIQWPRGDEFDPDRPYKLRYLGERRQVSARDPGELHRGFVTNAKFHLFKIVQDPPSPGEQGQTGAHHQFD